MATRQTWWVKYYDAGYYLIGRTREAVVDVYSSDRTTVCQADWHSAGGLRLTPGEGPVKITLALRCTRVKGE